MTRIHIKFAQWKHRMLRWLSRDYRVHDIIVTERNNLRREACELRIRADAVAGELATAKSELKRLEEASERAHRELFGERALRESAERRAEQYHADCLAAMKSHADWLALAVSRRPVFAERKESAEDHTSPPIKGKPFARSESRRIESETLRKVWEDLKREERELPSEMATP